MKTRSEVSNTVFPYDAAEQFRQMAERDGFIATPRDQEQNMTPGTVLLQGCFNFGRDIRVDSERAVEVER